jgi:peptidoglycan/LPS O-acetylase OafA/YrhL
MNSPQKIRRSLVNMTAAALIVIWAVLRSYVDHGWKGVAFMVALGGLAVLAVLAASADSPAPRRHTPHRSQRSHPRADS